MHPGHLPPPIKSGNLAAASRNGSPWFLAGSAAIEPDSAVLDAIGDFFRDRLQVSDGGRDTEEDGPAWLRQRSFLRPPCRITIQGAKRAP